MQYSIWISRVFFCILISFQACINGMYSCLYTCTVNPLAEIYPNQNMCVLLNSIPPALQNLSYVMYPNCDIYNTNRFGYNKRFNIFPVAIIVPETRKNYFCLPNINAK